jgi:hypothetical protein
MQRNTEYNPIAIEKNEYVEVLSESTVLLPVCNYYKRDHQAGQQEQWRNGMDGGSRI